ncbi:hypothetical protein AQUCO_00900260v1 [Aquilegia coerulea]|uniref:14-3-3 domain-containing protein n=1 Tax=Aquilegia coerulea TaxID=218851 RepID=A0A2G5ECR0_AQUCA|nr:hypothetical protein AQUCO_00900260v1 [Aquilegia coerulea]
MEMPTDSDSSHEDHIYMAKLAKLSMRFEDMVGFLEKVATTIPIEDLTQEEVYLMSLAYKNVIMTKRDSWRTLFFIMKKEKTKWKEESVENTKGGYVPAAAKIRIVKQYYSKIGYELRNLCYPIVGILQLGKFSFLNEALPDDSRIIHARQLDYSMLLADSRFECYETQMYDGIINVLESCFLPLKMSAESTAYLFSEYYNLIRQAGIKKKLNKFKNSKIDIAELASKLSHDEKFYLANLAEKANRYEETLKIMEKLAEDINVENLTVEERDLLLVAYKNVMETRWASLKIIVSIEMKEKSKGSKYFTTIMRYRGKIESELTTIFSGFSKLFRSHIPSESKHFLLEQSEMFVDSHQLSLHDLTFDRAKQVSFLSFLF